MLPVQASKHVAFTEDMPVPENVHIFAGSELHFSHGTAVAARPPAPISVSIPEHTVSLMFTLSCLQ